MDTICKTADAAQQRIKFAPDSLEYAVRLADVYLHEAKSLAAITPPDEVAEDHRIFIAFYRALVARVHSITKPPTKRAAKMTNWFALTYKAEADLRHKGYDLGTCD